MAIPHRTTSAKEPSTPAKATPASTPSSEILAEVRASIFIRSTGELIISDYVRLKKALGYPSRKVPAPVGKPKKPKKSKEKPDK